MLFNAKTERGSWMVKVEKHGDACTISLDDREYRVDVKKVEGNYYSLLLGNRTYDLSIDDRGRLVHVGVAGEQFTVEVLNPLAVIERKLGGEMVGRQVVKSVMPGKIVKLLVSEGDTVKEGQGVIVVEAMKMENEMTAPKAGKIVEISVSEGSAVEAGADLIIIE